VREIAEKATQAVTVQEVKATLEPLMKSVEAVL
jgi:hypothetical protein